MKKLLGILTLIFIINTNAYSYTNEDLSGNKLFCFYPFDKTKENLWDADPEAFHFISKKKLYWYILSGPTTGFSKSKKKYKTTFDKIYINIGSGLVYEIDRSSLVRSAKGISGTGQKCLKSSKSDFDNVFKNIHEERLKFLNKKKKL
jgi:hypothetical protein